MQWRIGSAMAAMAVCATACALLWPHARDAGSVLMVQDDSVQLSDIKLNSVLRNDPALLERNIEAALAAHDADLAESFSVVAQANAISLPGEL
ncbi:MAG: hypothetical protein JSS22_00810, partial [Proteobacteria bacterium]|nr:hypothetical protein [Pseudomonadota bacterium]